MRATFFMLWNQKRGRHAGDILRSGTRREPMPVPFCSRAWPVYALGCSYSGSLQRRLCGS